MLLATRPAISPKAIQARTDIEGLTHQCLSGNPNTSGRRSNDTGTPYG